MLKRIEICNYIKLISQWLAFISIQGRRLIYFSTYKFTSKQIEAVNCWFDVFPCLNVSNLFESLQEIKIKIESRLHCVDIHDDEAVTWKKIRKVKGIWDL